MKKHSLAFLILFASVFLNAQSALLPEGLGGDDDILPQGLGGEEVVSSPAPQQESGWDLPISFTGFLEGRYGRRVQDQHYQRDTSIAETRLQTKLDYEGDKLSARLAADFIYDNVMRDWDSQNFETGQGHIDLREANILYRAASFADVKMGRQILTWGVGDLLFINDLFPKDWNAFFIGRDEEYLKAPSDAAKLSLFSNYLNLDIAYMPRQEESRYIDGKRLSFYAPALMRPWSQADGAMTAKENNKWFSDDEVALRAYRNIAGAEVAAYYFNGYWNTPEGQMASGTPIFPKLQAYGASVRAPLGHGIISLEGGYYDSRQDRSGTDPLIRNSEYRYLAGYEQELFKNFTAGLQYYVERMADYSEYHATLPYGMPVRDKVRELWTLRLTQTLFKQRLTLSVFNYFSPTDHDGYIRPKITYKPKDYLTLELGGNIFWGRKTLLANGTREQVTFFGQFEDNSNIFAAVRYNF